RTPDAKLADDGLVRAAQYANNFAVGAAVRFNSADPDHHAVAMHGALGGVFGNVDIAAKTFDGNLGRDERVAVAVDVQTAGCEFAGGADGDVLAGAGFDDVAARDQPGNFGFNLRACLAMARELAEKLLQRRASMRLLAQMF